MATMNDTEITNEPESLDIPSSQAVGRIRSHSLKPRHSKQDYTRRKSAADASLRTSTRMELSTENNELKEKNNTPPPKRVSPTWFQRRFTVFSFDPQQNPSNQSRRLTKTRYSVFNDKSNTTLLKQKRSSFISQFVESFSRRFSLGKKKHHNDSEPDETVVDPVYETLKVAAETRKMAVANYLQNRQQSLNKQVSLNSQGSSELDTQSSPKASRHASRTESEISTSLRSAAAAGNRQGASSLDNARITNC